MTDIERIDEYFGNFIMKSCDECGTIDYDAIDILDIKPCLHRFEEQETDDSIYFASNMTYRSIGFLHAEVDVYIAMVALGIDKKLIELISYSSASDYEPYQIEFTNNGLEYMASEYIKFKFNNNDGFLDREFLLDIILHRCMKYHKNIPTFEKLLEKHGDVNAVTKFLDERTYVGNNLLYTGEYRILMLRWMNEHSVEEDLML